MSNNQHKNTPGPWQYHARGDGYHIKGERGQQSVRIATVHAMRPHDARLIAAAPDLLAICKRLESHESFMACECGKPECATRQLRAAIAKAEGPE